MIVLGKAGSVVAKSEKDIVPDRAECWPHVCDGTECWIEGSDKLTCDLGDTRVFKQGSRHSPTTISKTLLWHLWPLASGMPLGSNIRPQQHSVNPVYGAIWYLCAKLPGEGTCRIAR